MTFEEFKTLAGSKQAAPQGLPDLLLALWREAQGDWDGAHGIAQGIDTADAAWVHAYLHRKQGDLSNARYWYGKAGKPEWSGAFEEEWEQIARHLISI